MRQQQILSKMPSVSVAPPGVLVATVGAAPPDSGANLAQTWQGTLPDDEVAIIRVQQDLGSQALIAALKDFQPRQRASAASCSAAMACWGGPDGLDDCLAGRDLDADLGRGHHQKLVSDSTVRVGQVGSSWPTGRSDAKPMVCIS